MATSLSAGATRTDALGHEASLYVLSVIVPFKSFVLVQPELSYISLASDGDIDNGFGDVRLRARARAWAGDGKSLYALSGLRTGSGTASLFPYSTASIDLEGGLAFIDSLETLAWWVASTVTYTIRVDDGLKDNDLYGHSTTTGAGVSLHLGGQLLFRMGGLGYFTSGRSAREAYFLDLDYQYSPATGFYGFVQAEGGDRVERATDFALGFGIRVTY